MRKVHLPLVVSFLLYSSILFGGDTLSLTVVDPKVLAEAHSTAEKYWNAQKTSDEELFHSVTPHESMNVVFTWTFVRESGVRVEEGEIEDFRTVLSDFMVSYQKYKSAKGLQDIQRAASYAKKIEIQRPFLGEFLQKGFWETVTPPNFADSKTYKLMGYEYIADVEFQSKAGTTLKKRVSTLLRRLVVDGHDSGWKVFFVPGS